MHWLGLADPGCARQILDGGLGGHHVHARIPVARNQVHVGEQLPRDACGRVIHIGRLIAKCNQLWEGMSKLGSTCTH